MPSIVSATNYTASWIDWTDWNAVNGKCSSTKYTTQSTCVAASKTWTANNHNTWNGCVTDRGLPILTGGPDLPSVGNYDENVDQPVAGNLATLFPAYQAPSCPQAAMGLNYNWSAMTTFVNTMIRAATPTNRSASYGLADPRGGGAVHRAGHGSELQISASHHPAERRFEHPGPLVWQWLEHQHTGRLSNVDAHGR